MITGKKNVWGAEPGPILSWAQRVKISMGAATGLQFLHKKTQPCAVHDGIKSSNIFLFDNDVAKIGWPGVYRQKPPIDNIFLDRINFTTGYGYDAPEYATKCFTPVRFFHRF